MLTTKEAWRSVEKLLSHLGRNILDEDGTSTRAIRLYGLCRTVDVYQVAGIISKRVANQMRRTLDNSREGRRAARLNLGYYWPTTTEGYKARLAFVKRQAK